MMHSVAECPICLEPPQDAIVTDCCSTMYCIRCLDDWLLSHNTCPSCRGQPLIGTRSNDDMVVVFSSCTPDTARATCAAGVVGGGILTAAGITLWLILGRH